MARDRVSYECPSCGAPNPLDGLAEDCAACGFRVMPTPGVYDLMPAAACAAEREFYEHEYLAHSVVAPRLVTLDDLQRIWQRVDAPEHGVVRGRAGADVEGGKRGSCSWATAPAVKEFAFLTHEPELLVYSDISFANAVTQMRALGESLALWRKRCVRYRRCDEDPLRRRGSFDVVYGYAMVHHLPELDEFLKGVARVLAPGGVAVFMDDGYAPAWQKSKTTWLRPLMWFSHRRGGVSPEDLRASLLGGFRLQPELAEKIASVGGVPEFERVSLLTYLVYRASQKLLWSGANRALHAPSVAARLVRWDKALGRRELFRRNQVRLIWGFTRNGKEAPAEG